MGKFIIKSISTGFIFDLKAINGQIIATGGEVYNSLASVKTGIASVAKNAPLADVEDQTITAASEKTKIFIMKNFLNYCLEQSHSVLRELRLHPQEYPCVQHILRRRNLSIAVSLTCGIRSPQ